MTHGSVTGFDIDGLSEMTFEEIDEHADEIFAYFDALEPDDSWEVVPVPLHYVECIAERRVVDRERLSAAIAHARAEGVPDDDIDEVLSRAAKFRRGALRYTDVSPRRAVPAPTPEHAAAS